MIYLAAINGAALIVYGLDKLLAKANAYRVPEAVLILLAAAGGSVGALLGMYLFHHKTRKPRFFIGVPLILAAQIALVYFFVLRRM